MPEHELVSRYLVACQVMLVRHAICRNPLRKPRLKAMAKLQVVQEERRRKAAGGVVQSSTLTLNRDFIYLAAAQRLHVTLDSSFDLTQSLRVRLSRLKCSSSALHTA